MAAQSDDLETAIETLAQNQLDLIKLLESSKNQEADYVNNVVAKTTTLSGGEYDPFSSCFNGYASWPSSHAYDDKAGFFPMPFVQGTVSDFFDINGDGILDFIYVNNSNPTQAHYACVLLGNGNGLDVSYRCQGTYASGQWTFYGDCAA